MNRFHYYFVLVFCISVSLPSCESKPQTGEADMLHGCFKDSHISSLNEALKATDELLETHYKKGTQALNYQAYVKAMANRETEDSPIYDKNLKRIFQNMRDNRSFFEVFTKYNLNYDSHKQAADQGIFKLYMLDCEKPFYLCWLKKVSNPILKSYLTNYSENPHIDPVANLWYELDNMSVVFEEKDYENPETRMYIAIYSMYHLAFMLNPEMMVDLE